ncbi:hypothetical protein PAPYR_7017 [Paratrimastix pyriformis]|uniref:Uncharacterized protein n=1 Tax=Paratrimastix pyriformis TaxID=342808 RepID=A0ABQ8UE32_9EUKA|nr:hypothetical protein PAPYR_7017 [Paratrimastix pyriformis]
MAFRKLFSTMNQHTSRWAKLHDESTGYLNTLASIISRVPIVSNPENYGVLKQFDGLCPILVSRHIASIEEYLRALRVHLDEYRDLWKKMDQVRQDAYAYFMAHPAEQEEIRPEWDSIATLLAPYFNEMQLKQQLIDSIRYDMGKGIGVLVEQWQAMPAARPKFPHAIPSTAAPTSPLPAPASSSPHINKR